MRTIRLTGLASVLQCGQNDGENKFLLLIEEEVIQGIKGSKPKQPS